MNSKTAMTMLKGNDGDDDDDFLPILMQGLLMRQQERDAQQEKIEKSRQLPFHMHINLELLECVYLVSAMLLEIPYMACEYIMQPTNTTKHFNQFMEKPDSTVD